MQRGRVTIKDLAKKLGISTSTVSRALRGVPEVNPETKRLVLELAHQLEYEPNLIAQSLVRKKSWIVSVIVPSLTDLFFATVISGIQETANLSGYQMMVFHTDDDRDKEANAVRTSLKCQADGILLSLAGRNNHQHKYLERIRAKGVGLVLFDRVCHVPKASSVSAKDRDGAFSALRHLYETGHKNITFIRSTQTLNIFSEREQGFLEACHYFGLNGQVLHAGLEVNTVADIVALLLAESSFPDAIFAATDLLAIDILHCLHQQGIRVPDDVSIVGYGGSQLASLTHPQLTTVEQPAYEMGKTAMRLLLSQLLYDPVACQPEHIRLNTRLRVCDSSAKGRV